MARTKRCPLLLAERAQDVVHVSVAKDGGRAGLTEPDALVDDALARLVADLQVLDPVQDELQPLGLEQDDAVVLLNPAAGAVCMYNVHAV